MALNNDIQKIINWINDMKKRGIYTNGTAAGRASAIKKVFSVLGKDESHDPESLLKNCNDIIDRWARRTNAPPLSIQPAKSHARGALKDYLQYQKDPSSLKPPTREAKVKKEKPKKIEEKKDIEKKVKEGKDISEETFEIERPSVNINIEIHISAETTEKQIDKIFESMAKYIPFKKL
jgi:glutamyl/glutaminyl-tRNA synthetase